MSTFSAVQANDAETIAGDASIDDLIGILDRNFRILRSTWVKVEKDSARVLCKVTAHMIAERVETF